MNKAEFVAAVAEAAELSKADAARAVDAVISVVTKALKKGDTVTLVGFGTFQVRKRAARTGPQSADRRDDQDQGLEESGVQGWQGAEGCRKLSDSLCWVLSSAVERLPYTERVGGSKPSAPTSKSDVVKFQSAEW